MECVEGYEGKGGFMELGELVEKIKREGRGVFRGFNLCDGILLILEEVIRLRGELEKMKSGRVNKTVIHLMDDKGWNVEMDRVGDVQLGNKYFIPKRRGGVVLGVTGMPVLDIKREMYEFELVRQSYEHSGEERIKHIYYEMR